MKKVLFFTIALALYVLAAFAQTDQIPDGYVSLYTAVASSGGNNINEKAGAVIDHHTSTNAYFAIGPQANWNTSANAILDVSNYDGLRFKFTFADADKGNQIVIRYASNAVVGYKIVTFPNDDNTCVFDIDRADIANTAGETKLGAILIYNGSAPNGVAYTGTAATSAVTLNYVAVKIALPTAIAVVPENEEVAHALSVQGTTILNTQFTPANTTNKAVTWSSANDEIATVDANGEVTGVAAGSVAITATSVADNTISGSYEVTVTSSTFPVTGIDLTLSTLSLKMLNEATLAYAISPANATNKNVTWESSNTGVATVDATGKITPVSAGEATITVTTEDGGKTDNCAVTVIGYEPIPEGYESLYNHSSLQYNNAGTLVNLNSTSVIAAVPVVLSSNDGRLLGVAYNWNRNNLYVDLTGYDELQIALYFKAEDIGKSIEIRRVYANATATESDPTPANETVQITQQSQIYTINLANDAADSEGLRRLGAIRFRNISSSGEVKFNVDYVAIKQSLPTSIQPVEQLNDPVVAVKYYNLQGTEIPQSLEKGIYIVKKIHASQKVSITKALKINE